MLSHVLVLTMAIYCLNGSALETGAKPINNCPPCQLLIINLIFMYMPKEFLYARKSQGINKSLYGFTPVFY